MSTERGIVTSKHLDIARHPIGDATYVARCRSELDAVGALVLPGFFTAEAIERVVAESAPHEGRAFYANSTHNVYVTSPDPTLPADHALNRQVVSSKGLIAADEIASDSPLREVYNNDAFRAFLCGVLGIDALFPYDDALSSVNVHFAPEGKELGWHFDNSAFAVTMLLQAPLGGAHFEYVPNLRDADAGDLAFDAVCEVLDGQVAVKRLEFRPGDLVLFRGRNALHRVTPTEGSRTRLLTVFAFNERPGMSLSESSMRTFYGRTA